ncbi:MAG: hypothetical protein Q4F67_11615, partial [Propionibacteriaceae bacterium]|nr:hypothetical protein [Propionibacteriaceae bacterium]
MAETQPARAVAEPRTWRDHPLVHIVCVFLVCKFLAMAIALVMVPQFHHVAGNLQERPDSGWIEPDVGPCPNSRLCTSNRYFNIYSMWFRWDSMHYVDQVELPLLAPLTDAEREVLAAEPDFRRFDDVPSLKRFAWPPLYMLLGKPLAAVLDSAGLALMAVSNLAFLGALWFAYRLGVLVFGNGSAGRWSVTMLALLPTAFLLQAVLTEPLFLCLSLATFVFAHEKRWWWAGLAALLLGLTRSTGILIALPLVLLVLEQNGWRFWRWPTIKAGLKALPALIGAPLGWGLFVAWGWWMTGYWDAYNRVQASIWKVESGSPLDPFRQVFGDLTYHAHTMKLIVVMVLIALLIAGIRLIPVHFVVWGVLLLVVPLSIGDPWANSLLRYINGVFPLALLAVAVIRRWPWSQTALVATLAAFQGTLFLSWELYWSRT